MIKALSGLLIVGIVVGGFYAIAKKMDVFGRDNSDDDYSCH